MRLLNELAMDRCPHCGVHKPVLSLCQQFETNDYAGKNRRFWKGYACRSCGGVVTASSLVASDGHINEVFPAGRVLDESITPRARRHLQEAMDTLYAPSASIVASAAAVDAMLKARNYKVGSLYHRIDQAASEHLITADMAAWAHQVRLDANDQRHADEDSLFPEPEDSRLCLDFALALAEILFVLPARVTRGIAASSPSPSASMSPSASASPST